MYNKLRKMGYEPMSEKSKMRFRCDGCGECCKNREDIILNAYDIFRIRKKLDITLEELIQKYAAVYIGPTSKMPLIRLLPVGEEKRCPFLFLNKCIVHEAKPTICGLFPLGRAYTEKKEVLYFLQDVLCGERDNTQTVGEWVSGFLGEEGIQCGKYWNYMVIRLGNWLYQNEDKCTEELYNILFILLYANYDLQHSIEQQMEIACKCIDKYIELLDEHDAGQALELFFEEMGEKESSVGQS